MTALIDVVAFEGTVETFIIKFAFRGTSKPAPFTVIKALSDDRTLRLSEIVGALFTTVATTSVELLKKAHPSVTHDRTKAVARSVPKLHELSLSNVTTICWSEETGKSRTVPMTLMFLFDAFALVLNSMTLKTYGGFVSCGLKPMP